MSLFVCPVCKCGLTESEKLYKCEKGHCFDKSKFGYVNLLQSQKSSAKRHGDDRLMVRARRDFLDSGAYGFLRETLCKVCGKYMPEGGTVLDAGCGEGYYSSAIKSYFEQNGKKLEVYGVDISKDALEFLGKRKCVIPCAVASLFELPLADESVDCVMNIFSPEADSEFRRVLKKGGLLIRVIPRERHLFELKAAIYDEPYLNEMPPVELEFFECISTKQLEAKFLVESNEMIQNLFKMTPYYYKTGVDDQKKINNLDVLETEASFEIRVYRREI